MKKFFIIAAAIVAMGMNVNAQSSAKDNYLNRQAVQKYSKKISNDKASKIARQEAKRLKKEGWKPAPGSLPIENQLERSYTFQNQFEDDGLTPKYVWGDASSEGFNYDAGKSMALDIAQNNLARSIEQQIARIADINLDTEQSDASSSASMIRSVATTKFLTNQDLGQTTQQVELYRELPSGRVEVRVVTFYSMDTARKISKKAILDKMEQKNEEQGRILDKMLFGEQK